MPPPRYSGGKAAEGSVIPSEQSHTGDMIQRKSLSPQSSLNGQSARSVEPPQISHFQFAQSPYPIPSPGASPLLAHGKPLQEIPEEELDNHADHSWQRVESGKRKSTHTSPLIPRQSSHTSLSASNSQATSSLLLSSQRDPDDGRQAVPGDSFTRASTFRIIPQVEPSPPDALSSSSVTRKGTLNLRDRIIALPVSSHQGEIVPPGESRSPSRGIIDPITLRPSSQSTRIEAANEISTETWVTAAEIMGELAPPVENVPTSSPDAMSTTSEAPLGGIQYTAKRVSSDDSSPTYYNVSKPTCSLNLVCYRSGARGCDLQQLRCVLPSTFPNEKGFQSAIAADKHLVYNDYQFFWEMRQKFERKMCGFFRRYFSLKSLKAFRVLAYAPNTRPTVVPFDEFILQEMMYAYRNPGKLLSRDDWVKWVFKLRQQDRRHALEFIEGWDTTRIAIAGMVPWLASCLVGIIWTVTGGDAQTAFTVASFILTSSSVILALLAIISSIESSGR